MQESVFAESDDSSGSEISLLEKRLIIDFWNQLENDESIDVASRELISGLGLKCSDAIYDGQWLKAKAFTAQAMMVLNDGFTG